MTPPNSKENSKESTSQSSMQWFEWQSLSSDYLDGTLTPEASKRAEAFLSGAGEERERQARYRKIVAAIGAQPRVALPASLKSAPATFSLPKLEPKTGPGRNTRWERLPWFVRTSIEGAGIALVILLVVGLVPRLRTLYERGIEKRLDSFSLADFISGGNSTEEAIAEAAKVPMARGKTAGTLADANSPNDEFGGEDAGDSEDDESPSSTMHVSNSQVWRFNLKTDSPYEMRARVVHMLNELKVPPNTPGLGGIEAPGGIQFDLIVTQALVQNIRDQLKKLAGTSLKLAASRPGSNVSESNSQDAFTWYQVKSRKPIPAGKAHVVIWLSQI